jgi:hypothetical protein
MRRKKLLDIILKLDFRMDPGPVVCCPNEHYEKQEVLKSNGRLAISPVHRGTPCRPPSARIHDWQEKKAHLPSGSRPSAFQQEARDFSSKTKGVTVIQVRVEGAAAAI